MEMKYFVLKSVREHTSGAVDGSRVGGCAPALRVLADPEEQLVIAVALGLG